MNLTQSLLGETLMQTITGRFSRRGCVALPALLLVVLSVRVQAQESPDTIRVSSQAIIFFGPSQAERDSMSLQENSGIDEVLSDFLFYAGRIRPFLDSNSISVHETNSRRFVVIRQKGMPLNFDRESMDAVVGCILLQDGKEPRILTGVNTDIDLRETATEYYGLNSGTTEPPER